MSPREKLEKLLVKAFERRHGESCIIIKMSKEASGCETYLDYFNTIMDQKEMKEIQQEQKQKPKVVAAEGREEQIEIVRNLQESKDVRLVAAVLLENGWDYIDPRGKMKKSPEEVKSDLIGFRYDIKQSWDDLHQGGKNLLKTIAQSFLSYMRGI